MLTQKKLLVFFCLLLGFTSFAQKKPTIHEVGLSTSSGLDLGFVYKTGKENSVFRIQTLLLNGSHLYQTNINNPSMNINSNYNSLAISLGAEFRRNIAEKLFLIYGFDVGVKYGRRNINSNVGVGDNSHVLSPNVNLVIGVNYVLKEHWVFSVEILPYFQYDHIIQSGSNNANFTSNRIAYGLNISNVRLVVAHRFFQKENK